MIPPTGAPTPRNPKRQVTTFFLWAFGASWTIGLVGLLVPRIFPGAPAFTGGTPFHALAAYSVSITGIVMTLVYDGRAGLRRLFERLLPWRAGPQWYLIIFGGYGLMTFAALKVARLFGAGPAQVVGMSELMVGLALTLVYDVGPIGEEFGWRGFALPRMLEFRSPLGGTMILGAIHVLWHVPLFFIPSVSQSQLFFPTFVVGVLALAVFDTWVYLRTRANLLLAIFLHLMSNYCFKILGPHTYPFLMVGEAAAAIAIILFGGLSAPKPKD
jgi:uncharacterized protein